MCGGSRHSDANIRRRRIPVTCDGDPSGRYRMTRNSTGKDTHTGTRVSRFKAGEKR